MITCGRRAPDDRHEPAGRLVDVGLMEAVGMQVRFGVGHAGVAVAEHLDLVEADDRGRGGQFARPHLRHERPFGSGVRPWNG